MADENFEFNVLTNVTGEDDLERVKQQLQELVEKKKEINNLQTRIDSSSDPNERRRLGAQRGGAQRQANRIQEQFGSALTGLTQEANQLEEVLTQVGSSFRDLENFLRQFSRGDLQTRISQARSQRRINQLDSGPQREQVKVIRKNTQNLQQLASALRGQRIQSRFNETQVPTSGDTRRTLDEKIEAQKLRADAPTDSQGRVEDTEEAREREQQALEQLRNRRQELLRIDRERIQVANKIEANERRIRNLAADQVNQQREGRQLEAEQARRKQKQAEIDNERRRTGEANTENIQRLQQELNTIDDTISRLRENRRQSTSEIRRQQSLREQINRLTQRAVGLSNNEQRAQRAKTVAQAREKELEEALVRSGNQRTQEVERQEEKLRAAQNLQSRITEEIKEGNQAFQQRQRLQERLRRSLSESRQRRGVSTADDPTGRRARLQGTIGVARQRAESERQQRGDTDRLRQIENLIANLKNQQSQVTEEIKEGNQALRQRERLQDRLRRSLSQARQRRGVSTDADPTGRAARIQGTLGVARQRAESERQQRGETERLRQIEQLITRLKNEQENVKRQVKLTKESREGLNAKVREEDNLLEQVRKAEQRVNLEAQEGTSIEEQKQRERAASKRLALAEKRAQGQITDEVRESRRELEKAKRERQELEQASREQRRRANQEDDETRAQRDRQRTQQRLFGDGGASLFRIQSELAANFAILDRIFELFRFGARFVGQLDQELKNLQAITDTTTTEMQELEKELINVSEASKFTAVEVSKAATTLGQAGFSSREIQESIRGVTRLATATGSTLADATDAATNAVRVFKLQASETTDVADIFTSAINNSKLNLDKLTQSLQFAGNISAQAGASLRETVAAVGALANTGIRRGSKLGTDIRRIFAAFQKPPQEFVDTIRNLGLTTEDVSIQTNGLLGVIKNLREAGFTTADAMETLEIRAGTAFASLNNNVDDLEDIKEETLLTNSAIRAQETQMEGLINKFARLKSVFGTFLKRAGEPVLALLKDLTDGFTSFFQAINDPSALSRGFIGALLGGGIAFAFRKLTRLALGLPAAFSTVQTSLAGVSAAATTATGSVTRLRAAFLALRASIPFAGLFQIASFAIPAVLGAFSAFSKSSQEAGTSLDKLKSKTESSKSSFEGQQETIDSLNKAISRLINREEQLANDTSLLRQEATRLQDKFEGIGLTFDKTNGSVQEFIDKMQEARDQARDAQSGLILSEIENRQKELEKLAENRQANVRPDSIDELARQEGQPTTPTSFGLSGIINAFTGSERNRQAGLQNLREGLPEELQSALSASQNQQRRQLLEQLKQALREGNRGQASEIANELRDQVSERLASLGNLSEEERSNLSGPQDQLFRDITSNLESLREGLRKIVKGINEQRDALLRDARNELLRTDRAQNIESNVTQTRSNAQNLVNSSVEGRDRSDLRSNLEELQQVQADASQSSSRLRSLAERLVQSGQISLPDGSTIDDLLDNTVQDDLDKFQGEVKTKMQEIRQRLRDIFQNIIRNRIDQTDQQIKELKARPDETRTLNELKRIAEDLIGKSSVRLRQKIQEAIVKQLEEKPPTEELNTLVDEVLSGDFSSFSENERANLQPIVRSAISERNQLRQKAQEIADPEQNGIGEALDELEQANNELESAIRDNKFSIRDTLQGLRRRIQRINAPLNRLETIQQNAGDGDLSTAEESILEDDIDQQRNDSIRQRIGARENVLSQLQGERSRLQDEVQQRESQAAAASLSASQAEQSAARGQISEGELVRRSEEATRATEQLQESRDALEKVDKKVFEQEQKLAELRNTLTARTGEAEAASRSLSQQFRQTIKDFREQNSASNSLADIVGNGLPKVFNKAQSSFSTFITDMVNGTNSIGDAFKNMAKSILKSLQQVIVKALVTRAVTAALGAIGGSPSGSGLNAAGGPGGEGSIAGGGGGLLSGIGDLFNDGGRIPQKNSGGIIPRKRAKSGRFNPNRDSVPVLARPGEFVLRNSAVDAIGRDNLERINRQGNTKVSESTQKVPQVPAQNDKKEDETLNIFVVNSDERPIPGEKDIVASVSKDMAKGGKTKELVKQVQRGKL